MTELEIALKDAEDLIARVRAKTPLTYDQFKKAGDKLGEELFKEAEAGHFDMRSNRIAAVVDQMSRISTARENEVVIRGHRPFADRKFMAGFYGAPVTYLKLAAQPFSFWEETAEAASILMAMEKGKSAYGLAFAEQFVVVSSGLLPRGHNEPVPKIMRELQNGASKIVVIEEVVMAGEAMGPFMLLRLGPGGKFNTSATSFTNDARWGGALASHDVLPDRLWGEKLYVMDNDKVELALENFFESKDPEIMKWARQIAAAK